MPSDPVVDSVPPVADETVALRAVVAASMESDRFMGFGAAANNWTGVRAVCVTGVVGVVGVVGVTGVLVTGGLAATPGDEPPPPPHDTSAIAISAVAMDITGSFLKFICMTDSLLSTKQALKILTGWADCAVGHSA